MGNGLDTNTKLLFHFNGNDGAMEIVDSGNTGHIVTQVATAQIDTSEKKFGSGSLFLDGNSDYLSIPDSSDWVYGGGTGDFTLETWINFQTIKYTVIFRQRAASGQQTQDFYWLSNKLYFQIYNYGTVLLAESPTFEPNADQWYHVALVRQGSTWKFYVDGTYLGATTFSTGDGSETIADFSAPLLIGWNGATTYAHAYFDEIRISSVARWTSNFTPPTEEYESDSNTKLLLHLNSHDVSGNGGSDIYKVPDFIATAQIDTSEKKFGSGSLFLDGNSDYLSIPDSSDWVYGTNPFTIDFWVRFESDTSAGLYDQSIDGSNYICLYVTGGSALRFLVRQGGTDVVHFTAPFSFAIDTWFHIALVRINSDNSASAWRIFIDGVSKTLSLAGGAWNGSIYDQSSPIFLGKINSAQYLHGYFDEYRISSVARWTSNFTPPTEEYSVSVPITIKNQSIIII